MKKLLLIFMACVLVVGLLSGCSNRKYKDGEYSVQSEPDKHGNYATLKITVKDDRITTVDWKELTKDGKEKDENYGKNPGGKEEDYKKAQNALKISKAFSQKLIEKQDVNKIDGVSGATNSFGKFKEMVAQALEKAKNDMKVFTIEELKKYDGQNGNPAYIAIEDVVYDVSNSTSWKNGEYQGIKAGNDLTKQFKNLPDSKTKILEGCKAVGKLKSCCQ